MSKSKKKTYANMDEQDNYQSTLYYYNQSEPMIIFN